MKILLLAAVATTLLLPGLSASALPTQVSNTVVIAQNETAPLVLYVKSIRRSAVPDTYKIMGTIVNQSSEDQQVNSFDYKLWDRNTRKYVAVSSGSVYKTIPPGGRVVFETYINKGDVGNLPPSRLVLELTKFN